MKPTETIMKPTAASLFALQRDFCPLTLMLRRAHRQAVKYVLSDEAEYFVFKDESVLIHYFKTETEDDRFYF